jgi:hypothetical protein
MAMHLERVGARFVAAMAVLFAVAGNAASALEHKTYRCKVADVVSLTEDGHLRADDNPRTGMRRLYDGALIDTLTGAITFGDGQRWVWKVVQEGNGENDYVLTPERPDGRAARATTFFIRVRAWKEQPTVKFLAFGQDSFASGPCEVVR